MTINPTWIQNLRSNKFAQTQNRLCRNGAYCVLGLGLKSLGYEFDHNGRFPHEDGHFYVYFIPDEILPELGIDEDTAATVSNMNDTGKTFNQIADYLESHNV